MATISAKLLQKSSLRQLHVPTSGCTHRMRSSCGFLGDRNSATLAHRRRMTYACAHTVQWCAVAPEASQHPWRQEHLRCQRPTASACTQVRGPARFRASARPSGALTTVPHITAAQAAGTGCSFGRCQGSCDTCCRGTIGPPKSSPAAHHAAWVCTKPRARVGRHTRGPTYPDIDIGASQTDSALMRGTARCLRRRPPRPAAQPRRCGCVRLGCHMQKFQDPRVA